MENFIDKLLEYLNQVLNDILIKIYNMHKFI